MQSTRDHEQSLSREICIAFFAEYLIHRDTYWNSYWQQGLSKFNNRPKERQTICKEFIERIKTAQSLDEKEAIIKDLGIEARTAQSEKLQSENQSYIAFAWNKVLGLFIKDNSLFAKTCHAVRTRMVAEIMSPKHRTEHLKKIEQLRQELKEKNEKIEYNISHKIDASKLKEERDNIFNQLLDMQDAQTIIDAQIWDKFPATLPSHDIATLKFPQKIKPNPNLPLVYDVNYSAIFFLNEIKSAHKREHDFNDQLKEAVSKSHDFDSSGILDTSIFVPVDFESVIQDEGILEKVQNEKINDTTHTETLVNEQPTGSPKNTRKVITGNPSVMYQTKKEEDAKKEEPHNKKQSKHMRTPSNS